jgi:hypothetical protein
MMVMVMVMLAVMMSGGIVGAVLGRGATRGTESGDESDRKGGGGSGKQLHVFLLAVDSFQGYAAFEARVQPARSGPGRRARTRR